MCQLGAVPHIFISYQRLIVGKINQIKDVVEEEKGMLKGVFKLGILPTISPYLVPRLMNVHRQSNYDIRIKISELTTDQIIKSLALGTLDGAILATPLNEPEIAEYPLYYEKFFAYVSSDEKPLYAKNALEESDLTSTKLWLLDEVHCFRTQILHLCNLKKRKNSASIFTYEAGSIDTLINIVDKNDGITVIPEMALNNLSDDQIKKVRPFKNNTPVREISLITRKDFMRERMINIIKEEIRLAVPETLLDPALKKYVIPL